MNQSNMVVFLQDNKFMGFVEPVGAEYIVACATKAGHEVELGEGYFNVLLAKNKAVVKVEVKQ